MALTPQVSIKAGEPDYVLSFFRQMGLDSVSLGLSPDQLDETFLRAECERLAGAGFSVSDAYCMKLQKNKSIILGAPDCDEQLELFVKMVRVMGAAGIPFTSVAWQPNGVLRTKRGVGVHTRGGISSMADQAEIEGRPYAEGRLYPESEIWDNFARFLRVVIPECERSGVRLALHPNDPPLPCMEGVSSLIWRTEDYDRAFRLADSPMLGMKLCVGCWLEGGSCFGNLMEDIRRFAKEDRILCVHFRNVSAPLPVFEETLAEDGYADMYAVMRELVLSGCNAVLSVDHAFRGNEEIGGRTANLAYPIGYMKGLLHAVQSELQKKT